MRFIYSCIFLILSCHLLQAQVIYVSSANNIIHRLNMDDCTYETVCQVNRQMYDIAFHPDGSLYGISGNGNFYEIDTMNGTTSVLYVFTGQIFNSLTIGSDGLVYTIGNEGELWTYDLTAESATYLGDIGFDATGDLTFYKGEFYVAVSGDRIVRIDRAELSNSTVIINDDIPGNILGIVSDVVNCTEINCYAISAGLSGIYQINFETQSLQLVCQLDISVGGGASTSEFLASSPLQIDTAILIHPDCHMTNGGQATILTAGGSGNHSYALNGGPVQSSNTFTSLSSGMYDAIVFDQLGCEDTIHFELIVPGAPHIDTLLVQPTTCGEDNGTITAFVSGGSTPLTYSLNGSGAQSSGLFINLSGAEYIMMVTDQDGCTDSMSVILDDSAIPTLDSLVTIPSTCHMANGYIAAYASGGNGPLQYSLDNVVFQSTGQFINIAPGAFTVYIVDSSGCTINAEVTVEAITPASITNLEVTHTLCGENDGEVVIHSNILQDVMYSIDSTNAFQTLFTYPQLAAGNHMAFIIDEHGCLDSVPFIIQPSTAPMVTDIITTPDHCHQGNGSLEMTGSGGLGTFLYSIDGSNYQIGNSFSNMAAGSYSVYLLDEQGCSAVSTADIESQGGFQATEISATPSDCGHQNGTIQIIATGGTEPIMYALDNQPAQPEALYTSLASGNYHIHMTDASGCTLDSVVTILKIPCPIYIPNVFSPNGDGINDLFQIQVSDEENVQITRFFIFDRWGNNVYERFNLPAQNNEGWWDGTFKHFTMNPGVFSYYLEIEFENGLKETYKGNVTLLR